MAEADWVRHAVWWHVYPLGFVGAWPPGEAGAPGPGEHRLRRLLGWLDYAVELGASGLLLGPVFASATHGYDTVDYFRVDPRLGDESDLDALITAAHDRGLRVLLDGVFNHVARDHPAFRAVLEQGPSAPTASWFRLTWPPGEWQPGVEPEYETFEGHDSLVALNHVEPTVADYVGDVLTHWLQRGVDGFRLDAAYAVPTQFWAQVLTPVRAAHPGAYFVGEVIHGDYAAFVTKSKMDSVTQYELWKAIWSALNSKNFFELSWTLERHNKALETFVPQTFLGNHDVTRIATKLTDERDLPLALAILCMLGGTPSIYYGDEQAFRGLKEDRAGGDDAVRPEFGEKPDDLAPYGWPTYRLHQDLIGLRRRHPWLHGARSTVRHLSNLQLSLELSDGSRRLQLVLNVADEPADVPAQAATAVLSGTGDLTGSGEAAQIRLPAHSYAVLEA